MAYGFRNKQDVGYSDFVTNDLLSIWTLTSFAEECSLPVIRRGEG